MTYPLPTSQNLAKRRRRRGGRLALLAISSYGVLVIGHASSGCDHTCGHDWQCDRGEICVPMDGHGDCVLAPTCLLDTDCDDGTRCKLRSTNFVNDEPRDPFTVDARGRLTCDGYAGPKPIGGCGSTVSDDTGGGFGGSGKTSSATFSTGSSTGSFATSGATTSSAGGSTASAGGSTASSGGSTAGTGGGTASGATGSGP